MQNAAERHGWTKFVSNQLHYNLLARELEREAAPYAEATGMGILPWSSLARTPHPAVGLGRVRA
jgi:aryl-alcohol dehydrogenase-like predicted oxidoreductase